MRSTFVVFFSFLSSFVWAQKAETLGSSINSESNELHPLLSMDGKTMYFTRSWVPPKSSDIVNGKNKAKDAEEWNKNLSNEIWFSTKSADGRWSLAKKMPRQVNRDTYNDIFDISADGNTALIRNEFMKGIVNPDKVGFSIIKKKGSIWQAPEALEVPNLSKMAKGKYLSATMSTNGKVIIMAFSEKKNGEEDDIYVSIMDKKGAWSEPQSIGKDINTDASERSPYLSPDNSTLYFSSNRKGGQGGYDIWMSKRRGKGWQAWTVPVNLGPNVNSKEDEMYYSMEASGEYAYFTSENNTLGYSDIFRIRLKDIEPEQVPQDAALQTTVVADNTKDDIPETMNVVVVSGKVTDISTGKPIETKIIYEDLEDGEELGVANSNPLTGEYKIILPYGKRYGIRPELENAIGVSKHIDLSVPGEYKEITGQNLETAPLKIGTTVTLYNVFFEFAKATLEKESFLELDRMIGVMNNNTNMAIEVQGHTDNVGSDAVNMRLSQQRADAVKDYFLSKGISADRVKSTGFGEDKPVASNETTEGQARNRRVEFVILRK
jgi:OOP family OmpA-OmpF porin